MMNLERIAREVRKDVVRMHRRGTNVAAAMSCVDILVALYLDVMHASTPEDPDRDRLILSKGHAVSALYAVWVRKGWLAAEALADYCADGSVLTGHPSRGHVPGIDVSTGSLGHGLALATGMALAAKQDGRPSRHFVVLGDGELQEGSVWEAASLAATLGLDRLVAIVDANRLQGYGRVDDVMPIASFADKWRAFGWDVAELDGHDMAALTSALRQAPLTPGKPFAVIAHTTKGKGVKEMEDTLGWHYFSVPPEKEQPFLRELDGAS